jgi:hypothetical protein
MSQLTVRMDEELAQQVRAHAGAAGRSVNGWVVDVLHAAVDPELAGSEAERTRARLARAGLLAAPAAAVGAGPDEERLRAARRAAGRGVPLSELVSGDRG